jgi:hypothetical protein
MRASARSTFFLTSLVTDSWIIPTVNEADVAIGGTLTLCTTTGSGGEFELA